MAAFANSFFQAVGNGRQYLRFKTSTVGSLALERDWHVLQQQLAQAQNTLHALQKPLTEMQTFHQTQLRYNRQYYSSYYYQFCYPVQIARGPPDLGEVQKQLALVQNELQEMHEAVKRHVVAEKASARKLSVRIFVDGDVMMLYGSKREVAAAATKAAQEWLAKISAEHPKLQVFFAMGAEYDEDTARQKLLAVPGLTADRIFVRRASTTGKNTADALLTALFGKYAGRLNYVLSNDKHWFAELPNVDNSVQTVWRRFSDL
eukprot:TRINITY_DN31138_c0_g1_i2.p1 TRINITY_DN31138_c0_g1~~TRINITY_DN31138_c0_g1_i2.p1  ORF type:complete len:261 (+),score=78.34 TRINITY_DN31138_c0_g1_i2:120-902(+)